MFEGLKKKFSNFVDSFSKKEKEEIKEQEAEQKPEPKALSLNQPPNIPDLTQKIIGINDNPKTAKQIEEARKKAGGNAPSVVPSYSEAWNQRKKKDEIENLNAIKTEQMENRPTAKVTLGTKLKGVILGEVKISDKDVDPFIEQLKIALLESDVNYDVADKVADRLRANLVGKAITSRGIEGRITGIIRESILEVLSKKPGPDVLELARQKKGSGEPLKIMFLGPNGAGKTTTIAKFASMIKSNGLECVLAASDTFRAAAIEQLAIHAGRIGVHIIKGTYGADPASIAFDAIAYARAHKADVVLIDTAGRQETNKSLMEEMKKINRVTKPDLRIFIGESISGNALLDQVKQFNTAIGLDGVILTKLDVDAKGGNTLSILSDTEVPVLFFGIGEKYTDIMPYKPDFVVNNILPENN